MSEQLGKSGHDPVNWIGSMTYRSRAHGNPSGSDIHALASKARARNHHADVTGMLLYEDGHFLQTLEGPPANLKDIWTSISHDSRHSEIEILSEHIVPARVFSGWDLLVSNRFDSGPEGALLAKVEHGLSHKVPKLIDLALGGDDVGLNTLMATLAEDGWSGDAIMTHLLEPAARAFGDAWLCDDCTELDVTIGLSMLQLAGHAVRHSPTPDAILDTKYSILLATAPGEPHMLGTSMLADLFTDAGWQVDMAFPDSNEALMNQLKSQHPDAVDIGMSEALPRHHTLAKLRETVLQSREAAPDHLTVVSVGGRLFAEAAATAETVGADHARTTVAGSTIEIADLIRMKRQLPRQT